MRIAFNTRLLLPGKMDGIGWFAYETVKRIVEAHPEHTFYLFFDRKPEFHFGDNTVEVVLCPQARHPVLWWLFFEVAVNNALRRYKIDLFVSPDGFMPTHPATPTLTVIHDLNFEHSNDNLKRSHQWFMTHYFPRYAKNATRVATVSEYSKHDICATYGVASAMVDVVYDGAHNLYRPHNDNEKAATRKQYCGSNPYIIFISTILKRKNLANLLKAFDIVKESDNRDLKLVVVGKRVWWQDELKEAYNGMRHRDDVIMLGRVEPDGLSALLSAADAMVYPSYFEGFGIPILEAMYAETAVVTSNTTSMPEVGGDAALYANPANADEIARAILEACQPATREQLIEAGRIQRTKFSWERTASLLWESMMRCIEKP